MLKISHWIARPDFKFNHVGNHIHVLVPFYVTLLYSSQIMWVGVGGGEAGLFLEGQTWKDHFPDWRKKYSKQQSEISVRLLQ